MRTDTVELSPDLGTYAVSHSVVCTYSIKIINKIKIKKPEKTPSLVLGPSTPDVKLCGGDLRNMIKFWAAGLTDIPKADYRQEARLICVISSELWPATSTGP